MASLILLFSSFTGVGTESSQTNIKITKPIIEEAPISIGSSYMMEIYGKKCDNLPINMPFDTTEKVCISDVFRYRPIHPVLHEGRMHTGIDFAGKRGTNIKPAAFGIVKKVSYSFSYGNYVIIDHGNNVTSLYAHLKSVEVKEGTIVTLNTTIAKLGSTGRSTGPHLHFEVRINDTPINPLKLICNKSLSKLNKNKIKEIYVQNRSKAIKPATWLPNGIGGFKRLHTVEVSDHFARVSQSQTGMARYRYETSHEDKERQIDASRIAFVLK